MDTYGLLGFPLGHSFSKSFFTEKFRNERLDAEYRNFELPALSPETLRQMLAGCPQLRGFNVTIPYKRAVMPLLDALSDEAAEIGAVNVVKVGADGRLTGFNTDCLGFRTSLRGLLAEVPAVERALVLGTGGASRAVIYALRQEGIAPAVVSRREGTGVDFTYAQLTPDVLAAHRLVVNCTPLGMWPHVEGCPALPYAALTPAHALFDLVYNPEMTRFLAQGAAHGAHIRSGLEMLHAQAEAAWQIWRQP